MGDHGWLHLKKTLVYEIDYLLRRFKLLKALMLMVIAFLLVIISLGDTQSFFIGENSPIPDSWKLLKDEYIANYLSAFIIVASYFLPWLLDFLNNKKERKELSDAIEESLISAIENELSMLKGQIRKKFNLEESIRVSIFIPVRQRFFGWSLQMVCRTKNVSDRELLAKFQLDEGVIGHTFLKNQKHCIEFIDVSKSEPLPMGSMSPL